MTVRFAKQLPGGFLLALPVFIAVATTIYVSAASRQGPQLGAEAIDLSDPEQASQALLFNPFEPERPTQITGNPAQGDPRAEVWPFRSDEPIVDRGADSAADAQLAAADPPKEQVSDLTDPTDRTQLASGDGTPKPEGSTSKELAKTPGRSASKTGSTSGAASGRASRSARSAKLRRFFASKSGRLSLIGLAGAGAGAATWATVAVLTDDSSSKSTRSPAVPPP